jgi:hypothetical protein
MTFAIKPFKSLCVGALFFNCVVQMSYKASFYIVSYVNARMQLAHIDTTSDVTVLDQIVGRQDGVVRLDNSLGYLWRRENREGSKHSVWVFLPDLCQQ